MSGFRGFRGSNVGRWKPRVGAQSQDAICGVRARINMLYWS